MTIGLKRHYPAKWRVSAGWQPRSGITMPCPPRRRPGVARLGLGWNPLIGRRLGLSVDEKRASLCARARASCQWRQLARYTGRLNPMADGHHGSWSQQVTMECGEGKQKEGKEIVVCVCCYWTEAESDRGLGLLRPALAFQSHLGWSRAGMPSRGSSASRGASTISW